MQSKEYEWNLNSCFCLYIWVNFLIPMALGTEPSQNHNLNNQKGQAVIYSKVKQIKLRVKNTLDE